MLIEIKYKLDDKWCLGSKISLNWNTKITETKTEIKLNLIIVNKHWKHTNNTFYFKIINTIMVYK